MTAALDRSLERSLALHAAVAARLTADSSVIRRARHRVDAWLRDGSVHSEYAREWATILEGTPEDIARAIVRDDEKMRDLRQVSPFAGVLSARERWAVLRGVGK